MNRWLLTAKQAAVKMSWLLTGTRCRCISAPGLVKYLRGQRWCLTLVHWCVLCESCVSFSTHPQHKKLLPWSVKVPKSVQMRRLYVYALYMYLQHTLGLVRDTGVSLDQDTSLYSLYFCSNLTIRRNQSSSRSRLNKYIFTLNLPAWPPPPPLGELSCFAIQLDMCVAVCVCVQSPY